MRNLIIATVVLVSSSVSQAQFNDSLFFNSGEIKNVEILSHSKKSIKYHYYNEKNQSSVAYVEQKRLKYYKIYSADGQLTYSSRDSVSAGIVEVLRDSLEIARHTLSVNPFLIPIASVDLRYNYMFGKKMQFAINTHLTFITPVFWSWESLLIVGTGFKWIPYYSKRVSMGLDLMPTYWTFSFYGSDGFALPLSLNLDFFFGEKFGLAIDFGAGPAFYFYYNYAETIIMTRGHIGFLFRIGERKIVRPG